MLTKSFFSIAVLSAIAGCHGTNFVPAPPKLVATSVVAGVGAGTNFGFDLGLVSGNRYYFTDRNNSSVDVFDTTTNALLGQIKGTGANAFAGVGLTNGKPDNAISGPDGLDVVGNLLYAGDVNSVKVIDPVAQQVLKTIVVGTSGKRADEGCVDAAHNLYMISTPEADVPFATFISTTTQAVVAQVTFKDRQGVPTAGLEACSYDAASDTFYVNNDGSTDNPHGELVALPGASVRAIPAGATVNYTTVAGLRTYSEGNCDPTGMALGPGNDVAIGCREATTGAPLLVQIMDRTSGMILASVPAGGGDQIAYDPGTNRYYNAASRWTASGTASTSGACSAASPCTPVLAIIDAKTRQVVMKIPSGNNAHSVAVDYPTGKAFVPTSSATSPSGCATCSADPLLANAGLLIFSIR